MGSTANDSNAVFRAIADPARRLVIDELGSNDGQTLFEICVRLSQNHDMHMSRQAVTKHLNILESAGLIRVQWRGRTKHHFLDVGPIKQIGKLWLNQYLK